MCTLAFKLFLVLSLFQISVSGRKLSEQEEEPDQLSYHKGSLLTGKISVNLIWYGKFKPSQRAIISDYITSFSHSSFESPNQPSVATWWKTTEKYYKLAAAGNPKNPSLSSPLTLSLNKQILDEDYSLGKSLTNIDLRKLAYKGDLHNAVNVVLTSADVAVEGFCMRCGTHGHAPGQKRGSKFAYIWVGNSETQCPGTCAWPFHAPIYGPQNPPLVAPNNDVGLDGMVINLATLLAGTATNPFGNGYYQGPQDLPVEAGSACTGLYGKGAYLGYPGELLVDHTTGGSFNAYGANGRKFLLPALFDPTKSVCSTMV